MTRTPSSPTRRGIAFDLFAGGGGLSYGAEAGGFDVALGADHEGQHVATHHYNIPYGRGVIADLSQVSGDDLRRARGQTDEIDMVGLGRPPEAMAAPTAVFGGPPCQGFSSIGQRDANDPRNQLIGHFMRLVHELQPRYAVCENVPGLLQKQNQPLLDALLETIHEIGYNVVTPVRKLHAADFGVPQNRERVVFLLYRRGETPPNYPEPTHTPDPLTSELFLKRTPSVSDALDDLPDAELFDALLAGDTVRLDAADWAAAPSAYALQLRGLANDPDDLSYPRTWDPALLTCSKRTQHAERTRQLYAETLHGKQAGGGHNLMRLHPEGLSPTLRAGNVGKTIDGIRHSGHTAPRPIHHRYARVITVREGMRLHAYPDWVRMHASKFQGFRQLGNSVPPLMARAIAHEIRKAAGLAPDKPVEALAPGDENLLIATGRSAQNLLDAA